MLASAFNTTPESSERQELVHRRAAVRGVEVLHGKSDHSAALRSEATGQVFSHRGWRLTRGIRYSAAVLAVSTLAACGTPSPSNSESARGASPMRGGDLVVSVRSEPQSFSWYTHHDSTTQLVGLLTQAKLARVNPVTQDVEPWLATGWTRSEDGLRYTIKLPPGVTFADGTPFTAADVLFSVAAAYDARSLIRDALHVGGKRLEAVAADPQTIVLTLPAPYGPGLRVLDSLPIIPRHKLESALRAGTFGSAWGISTPPSEMTGLGPFALSEYRPGERMVFVRNERYFRKDASGASLPYLDRCVVEIVPDQDAQVLRLQAGQSDMSSTEIRPEDYAPLKRAADRGEAQLLDVGPSTDLAGLWINLRPDAFTRDPRRGWIQREEVRQAISLAVDRKAFVDTVYLGAGVPAYGPVTPANRKWHSEQISGAYDPQRASALLAAIGLRDRNGDGLLDDAAGGAARMTLLTQKGQTALERGAAVVRDDMKRIGFTIDVVALEAGALVKRFLSGEAYDAVYFFLIESDTDPAMNLDFWMSSGGAHIWNPGQRTPATEWERQIDELMRSQTTTLDEAERRRLFVDVQRLFAAHLPMVHFAAPRVFVAVSPRVMNLAPSVSRPQLLWSADTIAIKH